MPESRVGMRHHRKAGIQLPEVQSPRRMIGVGDAPGVLAGDGQDGGFWVVEAVQVNSITLLQGG